MSLCEILPNRCSSPFFLQDRCFHVSNFARKGLIYKLDTYVVDEHGQNSLLSPKEIQSQLQFIVDDADQKSNENEVTNPCLFTSTHRTKWAKVQE